MIDNNLPNWKSISKNQDMVYASGLVVRAYVVQDPQLMVTGRKFEPSPSYGNQ